MPPDRLIGRLFCFHSLTYWPALPDDALQPRYAGIRPKLADSKRGNGHGGVDFASQDARERGMNWLANFYGIESLGLTASLAIADAVIERSNMNGMQ